MSDFKPIDFTVYDINNKVVRHLTADDGDVEKLFSEYLEWLRQQHDPQNLRLKIDENPILEKEDRYFDCFDSDRDFYDFDNEGED